MQDDIIWAMFFSTLTGIDRHPGNKKQANITDLARHADLMLYLYQERFKPCPSSVASESQPSSQEQPEA